MQELDDEHGRSERRGMTMRSKPESTMETLLARLWSTAVKPVFYALDLKVNTCTPT
jgi:hypothetical protein